MAKAYVSPDDPHYADAALGKTIHTALGHWLEHDYLNPNWWHNQIGVPRNIGFTLLLLEPELTPEELQAGLKILERSTIKMTGQNRVWLAGNVLMRALLQNDADLARQARDVINSEFVVSADEGLQVDHSFHQHGPQLQLGNYGLAFANDGVTWLQNLRGTALALDEDKVRLLRDYLLQGLSPVVWRARMDISSCARQLTPHSPTAKARSVARLLTAMQTSDPDHAAAYHEALRVQMIEDGEKNPLTGNRLFWRSDYLVDRRADYCASVKMSSARTIGSEVVNEENLSGRHLGDGALYVY
jgi:chondroitin AC lyase